MLLIGVNSYSQTVPISATLENALITLGIDNSPSDLVVSLSAINTLSTLDVSGQGITDLSGIEFFTSLTSLDCSDNQLMNLDVSLLSNLSYLDCSINQLTTLNVNSLSNLAFLNCGENLLPSLNLNGLINLSQFGCRDNLLTNLNLLGLNNLTVLVCSSNLLTTLNVNNSVNLTTLFCNVNQLNSLDLSYNTNLNYVDCSENPLNCLNLVNLTNSTTIESKKAIPNIDCIQVSNVAIANSNTNWTIPVSSSYSLECSLCSFVNPCTTLITPTFNPIAPVCFGTTASPLMVTSTNTVGITGTWSPTFSGTIPNTYTFTPNAGQCATTTTLVINIAVPVTSQFINVSTGIDNLGNALAAGSVDSNWQLVSSPNPPGTPALVSDCYPVLWEPTPIAFSNAGWINAAGTFNMTVAGIYTFERSFTVGIGNTNIDYNLGIAWDAIPISTEFVRPDGSTIPFVTNPPVSPYYLSTSIPSSLPMTTMAGVWKIRTVSNFTDIYSGFLLSGTITVTTDTSTVPTFNQIAPICSGATLAPLPTSSTNNPTSITGTWSPALNNLVTTTYTFTPDAGQCATTTTMTIVVNPPLAPLFVQIAGQSFCAGELSAFPFPNVSDNLPNGIAGTWSPAFNNTVTTTYTFTPNSGQCATTTSLTVVITPNEVPTFNLIAPICSGATLPALSTTSNNNITGTWSPALNNLATTTYTFTPNAGQCATTTTMEVVVNTVHDISFLDIIVTMTGACSAFNGLYNFDGFLNGKVSYALSTDPTFKISFDGTKWVLWTGNITTDTGFQNTNVPVNNLPPTTGWTATQCVGGTLALSFPFYNVTSFCTGATVGSITPTLTNINYYTTEFGGTALASSTPLVSGIYYASQTLNGCQSNRAAVLQITVNSCGPNTIISPLSCGSTLTNINSLISAIGVGALSTNYQFEVTDTVTGQVQTYNTGGAPHFSLTSLSTYQYARTYSVRVMLFVNGAWTGGFSPACLVSTPNVVAPTGSAQVAASQCGVTLSSLSTLIATTSLPYVTCYKFRITDLTTSQVQTLTRQLHWFSLTMLNNYNYGTMYSIEVAVSTDCINFTSFGQACNVTTPAVPKISNYCGLLVPTKSTPITTVSLASVTAYRFEVTRLDSSGNPVLDAMGFPIVKIIDTPSYQNYFTMNNLGTAPNNIYLPNTNYKVRVAVMTAGTWSLFGAQCIVTSPATPRLTEIEKSSDLFEVMAYPNPFNNQFEISLQSSYSSKVSIMIYDMVGRLIENRNINASEVSIQQLGTNYPTGVYTIIVSQATNQRIFKMIKR